MTGKQKNKFEALDRLSNAFVDDILNISDEDILNEIIDEGSEADKVADEMRALFERTIHEEGKALLAAARHEAIAAKQKGGDIVEMDITERRRRYDTLIAKDLSLSSKLTMAARNGVGQSDRDIQSAIEDLAELGAFDDNEKDSDT